MQLELQTNLLNIINARITNDYCSNKWSNYILMKFNRLITYKINFVINNIQCSNQCVNMRCDGTYDLNWKNQTNPNYRDNTDILQIPFVQRTRPDIPFPGGKCVLVCGRNKTKEVASKNSNRENQASRSCRSAHLFVKTSKEARAPRATRGRQVGMTILKI